MKKQFCTYEIALQLKELGFNDLCMARIKSTGEISFLDEQVRDKLPSDFPDFVLAPLWQQVFSWFRKTYKLDAYPQRCGYGFSYQIYSNFGTSKNESIPSIGSWETYEKSEVACIKKLIEIVKQK